MKFIYGIVTELGLDGALTAALLTAAAAVFYNLLGIIQYFKRKAVWDFYQVQGFARSSRPRAFTPEQLAVSIAILAAVLMAMDFHALIQRFSFLGLLLIVYAGIFLVCLVVFSIFWRMDKAQGALTKEEYRNFQLKRAAISAAKYSISMLLLMLIPGVYYGGTGGLPGQYRLWLIPLLLVAAGSVFVCLEYINEKFRVREQRRYVLCQYQGRLFCVVSSLEGSLLLSECRAEGESLLINLDNKIRLSMEKLPMEERVFKCVRRFCLGKEVDSGRVLLI